MTLKEFKCNLDTQIMKVQLDANSTYATDSRSVTTHRNLVRLNTLLEVREAIEEVES